VKSAELLAGGGKLAVEVSEGGPVLTLPGSAPDAISSTIKLLIVGEPKVEEAMISADKDGVIRLLPGDARFAGEEVKSEDHGGKANIGYWTNPKDMVEWNLKADRDGKYAILIEASTPSDGSVLQIQGVGKLAYSVPKTGDYLKYQSTQVGEVSLAKGQAVKLSLRPVADGWQPVNVRKVELKPQP
jgi:hypothetical protein